MFKNIPVLVIAFNRPKLFKILIKELKKIKPKKVYIFIDGPRNNNLEDITKIKKVKEYISLINWNCVVERKFSIINLGCGKGPFKAITWFFNKEKFGIILEDDCIPSKSFFYFCKKILIRFSKNKKIGIISGSNFINSKNLQYSYYFSKFPLTWGWATWRRNWKNFSYQINSWNKFKHSKYWHNLHSNYAEYKTFTHIFNHIHKNSEFTKSIWDYRFMYHLWKSRKLNIIPKNNLIKNIGYGSDATHTKIYNNNFKQTIKPLNRKIHHPSFIKADNNLDNKIFYKIYYKKTLFLIEIIKYIKFYIINKFFYA
jgi:hypothetical protein